MSRLDSSLGHRMGYQEEVKCSIYYFRLLDKTLVYVRALGWISDGGLILSHLEKSLSNSLVDNDQSVLW
jgi:hypothetical protein